MGSKKKNEQVWVKVAIGQEVCNVQALLEHIPHRQICNL
jgi:hypothetical protein